MSSTLIQKLINAELTTEEAVAQAAVPVWRVDLDFVREDGIFHTQEKEKVIHTPYPERVRKLYNYCRRTALNELALDRSPEAARSFFYRHDGPRLLQKACVLSALRTHVVLKFDLAKRKGSDKITLVYSLSGS